MAKNKDGNTLLHFAAKTGNVATIKMHLDAGDDVNAQNNVGDTPLHIAYLCGKQEAAIVLVRAGATGTCETLPGKIPLDLSKDV